MDETYGDGSDHLCCPYCGFCITCGDCEKYGCDGTEEYEVIARKNDDLLEQLRTESRI